MKKLLSLFVLASLIAFPIIPTALAQDDIAAHPACPICGMDRQKFAHSRVLVTYDDNSTYGTCSIHCAAIDMSYNMDKAPTAIQVGDYNTKQLIDAEKAAWVVVEGKPGVMTKRAKWAFGNKADAEAFISANGGVLTTFEEAMKATYLDMYDDTRMIREKRKMMREKKMKQHS